jgi:hypothetical protein
MTADSTWRSWLRDKPRMERDWCCYVPLEITAAFETHVRGQVSRFDIWKRSDGFAERRGQFASRLRAAGIASSAGESPSLSLAFYTFFAGKPPSLSGEAPLDRLRALSLSKRLMVVPGIRRVPRLPGLTG